MENRPLWSDVHTIDWILDQSKYIAVNNLLEDIQCQKEEIAAKDAEIDALKANNRRLANELFIRKKRLKYLEYAISQHE